MKIFFSCFFSILLFVSCKNKTNPQVELEGSESNELSIFKVSKTNEPIIIDGIMSEVAWNKTESRTFDYFYKVTKPSDKQKSTYRMLWDDENLYVFYEFEDKYLNARETKRDGKPFFDDCAEIFIIPVPEPLDTHFCYEINLYKAVNDLIFFNNYYKETKGALKTFNPECEVEVTYNGTINDNSDIDKGWTMELKIPISVFGFLADFEPVKNGTKWSFLAIRQERNEAEGERRITSTIFPIEDFSKDVHQPKEFGLMEFVD